ncbi:hypothetical protein LTS18_006972, partial [Coniosporium uncinatum]
GRYGIQVVFNRHFDLCCSIIGCSVIGGSDLSRTTSNNPVVNNPKLDTNFGWVIGRSILNFPNIIRSIFGSSVFYSTVVRVSVAYCSVVCSPVFGCPVFGSYLSSAVFCLCGSIFCISGPVFCLSTPTYCLGGPVFCGDGTIFGSPVFCICGAIFRVSSAVFCLSGQIFCVYGSGFSVYGSIFCLYGTILGGSVVCSPVFVCITVLYHPIAGCSFVCGTVLDGSVPLLSGSSFLGYPAIADQHNPSVLAPIGFLYYYGRVICGLLCSQYCLFRFFGIKRIFGHYHDSFPRSFYTCLLTGRTFVIQVNSNKCGYSDLFYYWCFIGFFFFCWSVFASVHHYWWDCFCVLRSWYFLDHLLITRVLTCCCQLGTSSIFHAVILPCFEWCHLCCS